MPCHCVWPSLILLSHFPLYGCAALPAVLSPKAVSIGRLLIAVRMIVCNKCSQAMHLKGGDQLLRAGFGIKVYDALKVMQ